ncbi:unnamed protein product [Durusdinium trenchii]|uniref:Uncharacterized protein n=1 Tax=Durusdinium trenchii TaxID=1381693 RepID=A0ABP0SD45_9DINO
MRYCDVLADAADVTLNMGGIRLSSVPVTFSGGLKDDETGWHAFIMIQQAAILEMVQVGGVTLNKWPPIPLACQETSTEQETTFIDHVEVTEEYDADDDADSQVTWELIQMRKAYQKRQRRVALSRVFRSELKMPKKVIGLRAAVALAINSDSNPASSKPVQKTARTDRQKGKPVIKTVKKQKELGTKRRRYPKTSIPAAPEGAPCSHQPSCCRQEVFEEECYYANCYQEKILKDYEAEARSRKVPDLNQYPANGRGRGETIDGALPTLTTNSGKLFSKARWLEMNDMAQDSWNSQSNVHSPCSLPPLLGARPLHAPSGVAHEPHFALHRRAGQKEQVTKVDSEQCFAYSHHINGR